MKKPLNNLLKCDFFVHCIVYFWIDFVIWRFYSIFTVIDDYALSHKRIPIWWIPPKWNSANMNEIEFQTSKSCAHQFEVKFNWKALLHHRLPTVVQMPFSSLLFFCLYTFTYDKRRYGFRICDCDWKQKSISTLELMQFAIMQRLHSLKFNNVELQNKEIRKKSTEYSTHCTTSCN